ncbi:HEPN/Toprim-associated domain-containing protein [Streptococcus sp.]|uniref:HEPN/Toprim-associated domain-containing protein n=1 Tax=Streptococcus TaxID=1301 RepID=UPI0027BAC7CD|nr:HEPN/Toprim-associated domain-containing protein [Streptococcus sp.]
MGTIIELCANNLTLDWGKNNYYKAHSWLFSEDDRFEEKFTNYNFYNGGLAIFDNLENVKFRLNNLGYSLDETKKRLEDQINIWRRVHVFPEITQLIMNYISSINLDDMTDLTIQEESKCFGEDDVYHWLAKKIEADPIYITEKNKLIANLENSEDYFDDIEGFFFEKLDRYIFLRLLCENQFNLDKELKWFCHDIIESGWASKEDIQYFDNKYFVIEHNKLYGKLNRYAIKQDKIDDKVSQFDSWLRRKGLPQNRNYQRENLSTDTLTPIRYTTPTFIRNIIHHPENTNNTFNDGDLKESINSMLGLIKQNGINLI